MVTYNEYLKSILTQILDSHKCVNSLKDEPGDLDIMKKELLKINGFIKVILNKIDSDKIISSDFKTVKSKLRHYFDNYFFVAEIETMALLYSNDTSRVKNMRLKILESLEKRNMIEEIRELITKNMTGEKKCILCGCKDHKLFGCSKHFSKKCSCHK